MPQAGSVGEGARTLWSVTLGVSFFSGGQWKENGLGMRHSGSTHRALSAPLSARGTSQSVTARAEHGRYVVVHADPAQERLLQARQLIPRCLDCKEHVEQQLVNEFIQ